jgi:hypothetical protein
MPLNGMNVGEIGDVASRPHGVFAGAAQAEIIIALVKLCLAEPTFVILDLVPRPLCRRMACPSRVARRPLIAAGWP